MGRARVQRFRRGSVSCAVVLAVALFVMSAPPAHAADIDPDAVEILRSMTKYVGGLQAFSVNAEVDIEAVDLQGQKLQLSSSGDLLLVRPGKFYSRRHAPTGLFEFFIDGKTITLLSREKGVYFQLASPGSFEQAVDTFRAETGFEVSGADLLYADSYPVLMTDVRSGSYIGTSWVNGIECHQVAFRTDKVDWQLWVQTGDKPLPMKYIITTKWLTGAPAFSVRLRDWNTQPTIAPGQFDFKAPAGAKRLESLQLNELGEVALDGGKP